MFCHTFRDGTSSCLEKCENSPFATGFKPVNTPVTRKVIQHDFFNQSEGSNFSSFSFGFDENSGY